MARRGSKQQPLFPVRAFVPHPYEKGSIYDMLARFGEALFPRGDFPEADASLGGTPGWCPVQLSKLAILQAAHGWTDREAVRRGSLDLQVKACLGLGIEQNGPSQPTLCRHRQQMQALGLDVKYQQRLQGLLRALELVRDDEAVLVDSVPIDGAGQQLDTYNLLAGAVRNGLRELAARRGCKLTELAAEMGLEAYVHRSVKGRFDVDWSDESSRTALLSRLVEDALRVREQLAPTSASAERLGDDEEPPDSNSGPGEGGGGSAKEPEPGAQDGAKAAVEMIDDIIEHDVERDATGAVKGIKQQAAGDRRISITDPDMRHGRKSASQLIAGFKAQVVGTVLHGFILMTRVFKANEHDGDALPQMVAELRQQGFAPAWWGGDHAYGTIANHRFFAQGEHGELVARMARPANGGRFTKDEFGYDFASKTLTCPQGHSSPQTRWDSRHGRKGRLFVFPPETCGGCPRRAQCIAPTAGADRGRTVFIIDEDERLIRAHLDRREEREFRERLAHRPAIERIIAGFAQCGGKQAHRFGLANTAFDATLSALAYNLRRLGSLCAKDAKLAARAAETAAAL
ncbi:MAG: transposase, partial [Deltaproteobacteria bacterium]|nr:transposase [Deltaproteobacteria bacterium]